ncbi:hypothetical protein GCWU000325_00653 [Alloprevotella tannerae ATCC 51259]|uniref:Uncharacterized protein n=1 Tax=Alloprevotella tannerae ATCC 51259 TaxID=626522 RepID=C9LEM3_9BACT|nr:hypothetical protein GCWU000325_00653 [Alloprevotella tannerae ATCC 51259]
MLIMGQNYEENSPYSTFTATFSKVICRRGVMGRLRSGSGGCGGFLAPSLWSPSFKRSCI